MSTPHFNGLNPAEAERLAILSEECAEVIKEIGKILRHGYESTHPDGGPTNRTALSIEIGHVQAATQMLTQSNDLDGNEVMASAINKWASYVGKKYLHHQP